MKAGKMASITWSFISKKHVADREKLELPSSKIIDTDTLLAM
jgi:hypothetical protein